MKKLVNHLMLFAFLFSMSCIMAQENWEQFEKTQSEVTKLIQLPDPTFQPQQHQKPLDAKAIADLGLEQLYKNEPRKFTAKDGKQLFAYKYNSDSDTTILLLHGILSSAYMMNRTAGLLQEATHSEIVALDFRGHGQSEGTPGDVSYINQYVDDVIDVVTSIKKEKPNQKIILAGHSMGGGIILRYAMAKDAIAVDGYLLFAPQLGANSPTLKIAPVEGDQEPFLKLHLNRIIGIKMMNAIGETKYNDLPVLFFNLPESMPVTKYSYRANESMYPADYKEGLQHMTKPLLVVVGANDEAFVAEEFHTAVTENSNGKVFVIPDETHNGIRHNNKAMKIIANWFNNHNLQ
ncbi:alpha/beta hydrolase [Maribacter stanieri]|jgi:pimeloyl-ACP methyl ester carboxylesterase|uniref:Lysophospholipase, alpha-beta hydrolase superfamily n=1 Tax=Maribacter stanieri TaxID=440514 RepID=A0A1I6I2Q2_9FLAO|nr:alpha/beta fold hydrolase [Maribacter stanieri]SFR60944.1 Lysophospholipase, alpha-beta hydrolase superfamily [Maribacter stanieri]